MTLETEFAEVLDTIATSLGIAAERIFGIVVGAQPAIGIINITLTILTFLVAGVVWKYTRKQFVMLYTDDDGEWVNDDGEISATVFPFICAVFALLCAGLFSLLIAGSLLCIVCPEYTAMIEIVEWIR